MGTFYGRSWSYSVRDMESPNPGTIYRKDGQLRMYVRTETRNGSAIPEHLFVHVENRMTYLHWTTETPPVAELVVDEAGRAQANEERWLRHVAEHNCAILIDLLRRACALLPRHEADGLRRAYADAQPKTER